MSFGINAWSSVVGLKSDKDTWAYFKFFFQILDFLKMKIGAEKYINNDLPIFYLHQLLMVESTLWQ